METAFPRGGIKSHKKVNKVKDDDLFKVKQDKKVSKTKQKRNKRKKKQVEESTDDLVVVEPLSYKTLSTEMVILGCIETIKEYELKVILPGGSIGTVSIVNINNHYSNLLKSYTEDPKNVEDAVITLSGMFVVGQVVLCKVISTKYDAEKMKAEIKLSLDPKDVNGSLTHSCLYNGMILQAAVASIEDHGYVIDVGIEGVTSFLKYSNFTKNQDNQLVIGQLITCCIDIPKLSKGECIEDRTIILSLKTSLVDHSKVPENVNLTLHSLRPGMCLSAIVTDIQDNGLIVNCLDYKGCVYKDHLKSIWCKPSSYEIGQQVDGTVLYLHPISKHIYFSLHFNITPQKVKKMFGDYKIGSITEAKVTEIDKLIGVYFSIDDKIKALCTKKNLSDDDIENIGDKFLVGMTHKCRILGKNHIDKLLKISTKRSVVEKSYIPFEELKVGAIYKATVQKHVDNGMIVKLAHNVKGFIRKMDMSEICLNNPEKVFHPSSEVKCRILEIDDSKDPPSLLLTCKKTLVNSKLPILAKYEDAYPGMMVEGTIVLVKKTGLLVLFYNGVKGWITSRELSTEIIEYPEKVFHIGQVVKCCVLLCIPEQQIMKLTLKIEGKVPFGLKEMAKGNMFEVGNITDVKVSSVSDKGLDVIVLSHNIPAFLPVNHLSDNPANCKYLLHAYEIDEIIKDAVCFSTRGVLIVSKKSCFIQEAKSNKVAKQFSDFEEGIIVPAIVKGFATFGMFIETFNNVVGLVPLKRMLNEKVEEASKAGYVIHQSIMAKVITLDKTKERIVFSTKLNNCYLGNTEPSLDILENYLNEWMKIKEYYKKQTGMKKKLAKLEIGQVVNVTITEITDIGVLCKVQNDLPGVVIKEHLGGKFYIFK
ncbi:protein RRP5 homolog [Centruroides sculpturatus]|uniref:protein RRP5 homolog n=1 Tax=Centruroides sculpturatus TaxID=218467 RepID=UPI000C6DA3D5|nr:protein RRP5 homolog [Centruroides sculpturatus]